MKSEVDKWFGRYAGSGIWCDTAGQIGSYTTELVISSSNNAGLRFEGASIIELPNGDQVPDSVVFHLRNSTPSTSVFAIDSDKLDMEGFAYFLKDALILKYTFADKNKRETITESYSLDSKVLRHTGLIEQALRVIFISDQLSYQHDTG